MADEALETPKVSPHSSFTFADNEKLARTYGEHRGNATAAKAICQLF
jgi:hypothetical protein